MSSVPIPEAAAPRLDRTRPSSGSERPATRLRAVLTVNASTSLIGGAAVVAAAPWWADRLGFGNVGAARVVGVGLVVFGVAVALGARRRTGLPGTALATSILDIAWVLATIVVLVTVDLTTAGTVVAIVTGLAVADFATAQLWYRSRLAGGR